jgi:site-specific DNA-methyltransferase (adenine-specific)
VLFRSLVVDSFLGSGSTLIACEKTNRVCYGMELDPKYIDVIIKRYIDFSGNKVYRIENNKKLDVTNNYL